MRWRTNPCQDCIESVYQRFLLLPSLAFPVENFTVSHGKRLEKLAYHIDIGFGFIQIFFKILIKDNGRYW